MIDNGSGCKFKPGTMLTHVTSMGLWHPALDTNNITVGISGIAGKPARGNDDGLSSRSQWYG